MPERLDNVDEVPVVVVHLIVNAVETVSTAVIAVLDSVVQWHVAVILHDTQDAISEAVG